MDFVTGATGFVGNHLVRALLQQGESVRCLVRASSNRDLMAGLDVEAVEGDVRDLESLRRGMRGCRIVYHCAADYRLYVPDPDVMHACNVDGTRNVITGCLKHGVFKSVHDLHCVMTKFLEEHNDQPNPFVWTVYPNEIIATIKRENLVLDSIHW